MSLLNNNRLKYSFLKLTESNQVYILGIVEGLRHAQNKDDGKLIVKKELIKYKKN